MTVLLAALMLVASVAAPANAATGWWKGGLPQARLLRDPQAHVAVGVAPAVPVT